MNFSWDENKAASNLEKHGISFDEAMLVFADPFLLMNQDRIENGKCDGRVLEKLKALLLFWLPILGMIRTVRSISVLSQPVLQIKGKRNVMSKIVTRAIDLSNPPKLTDEAKARLAKLNEAEIDYSDIPPLKDDFWANAVSNPLYKPTKQIATVRIDSDVLLWLKSQGKGYQTRMNAILRQAMLTELAETH